MSAGWNTIESDAGVFTYLIDNLGVKDVQFEELLSLDVQELRSLSPLYGVIFLFKYPTDQKPSATALDGNFSHSAAESIFFANQTIQNACGTQALLSVLLNKPSIEIGSSLKDFKDFTSAFPPDLRGEALSNSEHIRDVHNSFARSSPFVDETQRQATGDEDVFHFIAYTEIEGRLYELDGLQPAPIDHGTCQQNEFAEKVIPVLQRRIERYPQGEIRFNLLAVCRDLRLRAKEIGDSEGVEKEERKREGWLWENALRRHNFVGFVGEAVRGVVKEKVKTGEYDAWIKAGEDRTRKRMEDRRKGQAEEL